MGAHTPRPPHNVGGRRASGVSGWEGEDYYGVVEEFCTAVKKLWPNALLQARSVGGTVVGQGVECLHACTHAIRFALHAGPLTLTCTCLVPPSSHLQFEDFQTERVR